MAMPASGTFDYVAIVPEAADDGNFECTVQSAEAPRISAHNLIDDRLVGLTPKLTVAEAGITPDPGPGRPFVMRSRLTLTASSPENATVAAASFHVDRALARRMQPGDRLHLGRTHRGGLALSLVRKSELVVAVGAVIDVPLGRLVTAKFPYDLIDDVVAIFRRRDHEFELPEIPVEVIVGGSSKILASGGGEIGEYEIFVTHGFLPSLPGADACAAIWRTDLCPSVAARATAELMDSRHQHPLAMVPW
jgi:hypothetical protein